MAKTLKWGINIHCETWITVPTSEAIKDGQMLTHQIPTVSLFLCLFAFGYISLCAPAN